MTCEHCHGSGRTTPIPELIALAWDAHLDAGRDISDPRFVSIVRRFSVADRWAIVNGVEALQRVPLRVSGIVRVNWPEGPWYTVWVIPRTSSTPGSYNDIQALPPAPLRWYRPQARVNEWARFRLSCLEVWASMSLAEFADRNRHRVIDKSAVWTDIDAEYATIRSHWCGQRGRPKDDELRLIRTWLDHRPVGDRSTNLDRGRMMVVLDKYDARREPKPSRNQWMIDVLDRWTNVTDEERERWTPTPHRPTIGELVRSLSDRPEQIATSADWLFNVLLASENMITADRLTGLPDGVLGMIFGRPVVLDESVNWGFRVDPEPVTEGGYVPWSTPVTGVTYALYFGYNLDFDP